MRPFPPFSYCRCVLFAFVSLVLAGGARGVVSTDGSVGPVMTIVPSGTSGDFGIQAGLGTLILEAYASRDLPVLEGAVVASGALFVLTQGLAALAQAAMDPRVRA